MFLFMWPHLEDLEITEITEILRSCSHVWEVTLELPLGGKQDILGERRRRICPSVITTCHQLQLTIGKWFVLLLMDRPFPDKSV